LTYKLIHEKKQEYLAFLFKESAKEERSLRKRTTIWDVLSDLGGIMEIIILGVPLFIFSYRDFKFKSDLVKELYVSQNNKNV